MTRFKYEMPDFLQDWPRLHFLPPGGMETPNKGKIELCNNSNNHIMNSCIFRLFPFCLFVTPNTVAITIFAHLCEYVEDRFLGQRARAL